MCVYSRVVYAYIYTHTHTCMHAYIHTYIRTCIRIYVYVCIYICVSALHLKPMHLLRWSWYATTVVGTWPSHLSLDSLELE